MRNGARSVARLPREGGGLVSRRLGHDGCILGRISLVGCGFWSGVWYAAWSLWLCVMFWYMA